MPRSEKLFGDPYIRTFMGRDLPCKYRHQDSCYKDYATRESDWLLTGEILQSGENGRKPRWFSPNLFCEINCSRSFGPKHPHLDIP